MREISRIHIPIKGNRKYEAPVRSLNWHGDELVDWVGGITIYQLDKTVIPPKVGFSYPFDAAIVWGGGEFTVLYQRLGTKGLILKLGKPIREINRSFYHANAYEYPLAFLKLPNGRIGLIHCPDQYCRLEIEDVETGERLTARDTKSVDFFHSRLSVSPNGRYLLSAGWIWHPFEYIHLFEVTKALSTPSTLDAGKLWLTRDGVTIPSGFVTNKRIIFTTGDDFYSENDFDEEQINLLPPQVIAQYNLSEKRIAHFAPLPEIAGIIYPFSQNHVFSCYTHPKIIDLTTGEIIAHWDEFQTGEQVSSIVMRPDKFAPPIAIDPNKKRFAIASDTEITVIQMG